MKLHIAKDYSTSPGPRYESEGKFSGQDFRKNLLLPRITMAESEGCKLLIDLDGTSGYGTSFLEEAFGGLIRENGYTEADIDRIFSIKSDEEPELINEIREYIRDAQKQSGK